MKNKVQETTPGSYIQANDWQVTYNPGHNIIGILPKIKVMLSLSPPPPPLHPLAHDEPDLDFLAALACSKKKVKQHWPGWRG